jgi:hypothetical protein
MRTRTVFSLAVLLSLGLVLTGTVYAQGMAGASHEQFAGDGKVERFDATGVSATGDLSVLYVFSGVSDDGEQGSTNRREATSVHCTNVVTENVHVEVQIYQWNGTNVYTGTVTMPANRTFTFSTQNTTIYFDDVILGGSPGTDAIFQGSGRVLADHPGVICTAQVLDPLNYPPEFNVKLQLYYSDGTPVGGVRKLYLPLVVKNS